MHDFRDLVCLDLNSLSTYFLKLSCFTVIIVPTSRFGKLNPKWNLRPVQVRLLACNRHLGSDNYGGAWFTSPLSVPSRPCACTKGAEKFSRTITERNASSLFMIP